MASIWSLRTDSDNPQKTIVHQNGEYVGQIICTAPNSFDWYIAGDDGKLEKIGTVASVDDATECIQTHLE